MQNDLTYSISNLTNEIGVSPMSEKVVLGLIKVCVETGCESVFHNCPEKVKRCEYCNGSIKMINQETYFKKFSDRFFQYDQPTGEYFRPQKEKHQLTLDLDD